MKYEDYKNAQAVHVKMLDLQDKLCNLNYCLGEIKNENREITLSLDESPDCNSIPFTKEELINHIEGKIKYYQQEFDRYKRKFEKI